MIRKKIEVSVITVITALPGADLVFLRNSSAIVGKNPMTEKNTIVDNLEFVFGI